MATEQEIMPLLTAHGNNVYQNEALFARVKAVYENRATLSPVQRRLVEKYHRSFVESGAALPEAARNRAAEINIRLSELATQFGQNILAENKDFCMWLEGDDLQGLPQTLLDALAASAAELGQPGKYALTYSLSVVLPFLTFSTRRELRERVETARKARGDHDNAHNNTALMTEIATLRAELAQLMGFNTYSAYALDDTMAHTPANAKKLLDQVWAKAKEAGERDRADLQLIAADEGLNGDIRAWDWRYYAEKLRQQRYALSEEETQPYFTLDRMIEASFSTASQLFGIDFAEVTDLALHHPDARAWKVTKNGQDVALFIGDYYARASKQSGAWMSELRGQNALTGELPVIYNVCNFNKPAPGKPSLLSMDDVRTIFHEFGHALHGMLSRASYPGLAGTNVSRDFVELPSQLFEHWALTKPILSQFARHYETGEAIPDALIDKIRRTMKFDTAHQKVEYTSAAMYDLAIHDKADFTGFAPAAFEQDFKASVDMPAYASMIHRPPNFKHIFEGGYSSMYYSYLWSEVLDADAFEAFEETGNVFSPEVGQRLHDYIYSAGNSEDPAKLYEKFRGRPATIDALLRKLGFAADEDAPQATAIQNAR